jgi:hypothetical protein
VVRSLHRLAASTGCLVLLLLPAAGAGQGASVPAPAPAVPADPITAIVDAFRTHAIVALGEGDHGNQEGHEFRLALIRDPRFATFVNDIVVEFGNSLYQQTIDRYVLEEADVPYGQLRKIWENTTQPFVTFDLPIYGQFFDAVRSLNRTLPPQRRVRVLLGDPPIDWDKVRTKADAAKWLARRGRFPVDLIRREVLARNRRALLIYGDMHFQRRNLDFNYSESDGLTIVGQLERGSTGTPVFTVWTNTSADLEQVQDVSGWPIPSLALTRGTVLGARDFTFYYRFGGDRVRTENGALVPIPRNEWRTLPMADQFDAILYLGPPSAITHRGLSPALCGDSAYLKMRIGRLELFGFPAGVEKLKSFCASRAVK